MKDFCRSILIFFSVVLFCACGRSDLIRLRILAPVVEKVQKAINEVAKNGKFSYILDTGTGFNVVLYNEGPNSHDITDDVKKKLNL